jgi:isoamylase
MLVAGDEISRTQNGNNNAYCQDNELSWLHWEKQDKELLQFYAEADSLLSETSLLYT